MLLLLLLLRLLLNPINVYLFILISLFFIKHGSLFTNEYFLQSPMSCPLAVISFALIPEDNHLANYDDNIFYFCVNQFKAERRQKLIFLPFEFLCFFYLDLINFKKKKNWFNLMIFQLTSSAIELFNCKDSTEQSTILMLLF